MSFLTERVRGGPARPHLMTAAYHTPNGPLHLGHVAGPFLTADVVARHLETLGHTVARLSSTDSHESYILLTSRLEGRTPEEVASGYHESAADTLTGFAMPQDSFFDVHREPYRSRYHELSHRTVERLKAEGRLRYEEEKVPYSTSTGQGLVGAFALGNCPNCAVAAAGSSCESCGIWFGPGDLRDPRPRLAADGRVATRSVPSAFLEGHERYFSGEEAARRFAPPYAELLEKFVEFNGRRIRLNHPLGWGVPWSDAPADGLVHLSYGTGTFAAFALLRDEYRRLHPGGDDPFARDTSVVTLSTGGYDATLPWMFLLAFMDETTDWQPYQHHILNRFFQLNGEKFSTSRGHVIWGHDYLAAGLPVDPLRMYAARIAAEEEESDFRTADFSAYVDSVLVRRWDPLIREALDAAAEHGGQEVSLDIAADALTRTADAFRPPNSSLRTAAAELEDWVSLGERGLADREPLLWLATLSVLAYPIMPGLGQQVWSALGLDGFPRIEGLEGLAGNARVRPGEYSGIRPVPVRELEALLPEGEN